MKARLLASARRALYSGVCTDPRKHFLKLAEGDRVTRVQGEEGRVRAGRRRQTPALPLMFGERVGERVTDGRQTRFEEFGVADGEDVLAEVHIAAAQAQPLARTKSRPVQGKKQGPESPVPERETAVLQHRRCIEEAPQFIPGIDVGPERMGYARPLVRQWTGSQMPAAHQPGKEAAQSLVLALPPPCRRPFAAAEVIDGSGIDPIERNVAECTAKGTKNGNFSITPRHQEGREALPHTRSCRLGMAWVSVNRSIR